ncbi:uncharacterized protein LOC141890486 [Acropora palmata]|uniref:uncharacterized protein LOC141890486 n=1 Tax=Acropora palmata TaxID=6131 RepID=UPI003DA13622
MATASYLPDISQQKPMTKDYPKMWQHRKDLSHWSKYEVPCMTLVSQMDTDHWAKLKGKHIAYVQSLSRDNLPSHSKYGHSQHAPGLSNAFHKYYYDKRKHREELLKRSYTMYYHGKPVEDKTFQGQNCVQRSRDQGRPSIYHQRAKQGFQFWLEQDPMVKKIALSSKYTFGSKSTFHGLGNAPRN